MSSVIVTWVEGVKTYLATQFADADIRIGEPDVDDTQNQREKDLILIWLGDWNELASDMALAAPYLLIRWLPAKSRKQPRRENPNDPTVLYQAMEDLMVAMKTKGRFGDIAPRVACHISSAKCVTKPAGSWYVEATLLASSAHLAVSAA